MVRIGGLAKEILDWWPCTCYSGEVLNFAEGFLLETLARGVCALAVGFWIIETVQSVWDQKTESAGEIGE